ncbi:zinc-ribbon domain-containing protein [Streptomyces goshikiensis]|uniref:zinc-ribbon domain-containing protein n=1 Tax=Streptomyces goshikiensis TaxID=1942 RepID=UPI0033EBA382
MAEMFLREGRQELPVDGDYDAWCLAQTRRLAEARQAWVSALTHAGWALDSGAHSLAYLRPDLLEEYDFEQSENPPNLPYTAKLSSSTSVWWRCARDENHQWTTSIANRHVVGTGCPRCGKRGVSRREQEIFTALRALLPQLSSPATIPRHDSAGAGRRRLRSWRVDMLLPGTPTVVVEYDGAYWHQDHLPRDQKKTADLEASGHLVIRVREHPLPLVTANDASCTAEQSADDVAERVFRKVEELLGAIPTPLGPGPKAPAAAEPKEPCQLELFPRQVTADEAARSRHGRVMGEVARIHGSRHSCRSTPSALTLSGHSAGTSPAGNPPTPWTRRNVRVRQRSWP